MLFSLNHRTRNSLGLLTLLALLLGSLASPPTLAQSPGAQIVPDSEISLQAAADLATAHRPGRVIRAVTVNTSGRRIHEIRILLDEGGRVVTVRVDARSSELL